MMSGRKFSLLSVFQLCALRRHLKENKLLSAAGVENLVAHSRQ
jgi:hypothetical protein